MDIEPRFVIVGSGRSGTGYIAAVLTAAGIGCGHEEWFNPLGVQVSGLTGDASWCAVPHLDAYGGIVFHQTRHPLAAVASLAAQPLWGPYAALAAPYLADDSDEPYAREAALWVALNEACEARAVRRWQVEEVDVDLILEIAARVGVHVDPLAAKTAVADTPTTLNAHHDGPPIGWADLPATRATADLVRLAVRYGYLL